MDRRTHTQLISPNQKFRSLTSVQTEVKQRARAIFADWTSLFELLERYETVLRNRWLKKSAQQRRRTLLTVCPDIPQMHRPDFEAIRSEEPEERKAGTRYLHHFTLPSINLVDLMIPKNLLLFIHARGRTKPDAFAKADFNSLMVAILMDATPPPYLSGYTMLLIGQKDAENYGRLISWNDDPEAYEMIDKGSGMTPGDGLLVLQVQERKLSFLLACAKDILRDLPLEDASIPKQPAPPPVRLGNEDSEWPSVRKEILEAPYRVPPRFDFAKLQSFVNARRGEAEDRIWLLREDPIYFRETIIEWSEHRQEQLKDIDGKPLPVLSQNEFWERILHSMLTEVYCSFIEWHLLEKDVQYAESLRARFSDPVKDPDLPQKYGDALCNFSYFTERILKSTTSMWKVGMVASPAIRDNFQLVVTDPDNPDKSLIRSKSNPDNDNDYFLWLMGRLTMQEQTYICDLQEIVDEIERLIRTDPRCHERLSPWLAEILSYLSVLAELQRQVELFPHVLAPAHQQETFLGKTRLVIRVFCVLQMLEELAPLWEPLSRLDVPSDERRTSAATEKLQEAERALDSFWKVVDDHVVVHQGKVLHDVLSGVISKRDLRRTEDWKEPESALQSLDENVDDLTHQLSTSGPVQSVQFGQHQPFSIGEARQEEPDRALQSVDQNVDGLAHQLSTLGREHYVQFGEHPPISIREARQRLVEHRQRLRGRENQREFPRETEQTENTTTSDAISESKIQNEDGTCTGAKPESKAQNRNDTCTENNSESKVHNENGTCTDISPESDVQNKNGTCTDTYPESKVQDENGTCADSSQELDVHNENGTCTDTNPESKVQNDNKTCAVSIPKSDVQKENVTSTDAATSKAAETLLTIKNTKPDTNNEDPPKPTLTVSKRGYRVFTTLFFDPSTGEQPPDEIPWPDFLHAMRSVGFAIKSLDGSGWLFVPPKEIVGRSMIFHEPHWTSRIDGKTARRFGRRLEWGFGWGAGTFVRG